MRVESGAIGRVKGFAEISSRGRRCKCSLGRTKNNFTRDFAGYLQSVYSGINCKINKPVLDPRDICLVSYSEGLDECVSPNEGSPSVFALFIAGFFWF